MIKIIAVGKIKSNELKAIIKDYEKRLSKYTNFKIIELDDIAYDDINKVLEEEYIDISKQIKDNDYLVVMDINGVELDSIELSNKIDNVLTNNRGDIAFIIGGSYGISDKIKDKANLKLSFSKLTFPHQLFRLILIEQIYRSFKIMKNESYHK